MNAPTKEKTRNWRCGIKRGYKNWRKKTRKEYANKESDRKRKKTGVAKKVEPERKEAENLEAYRI